MARVFVLVEDEAGRQTGRGASFTGVLGYVLRDAGPESWRGTFGLSLPIAHVASEMDYAHRTEHLRSSRPGPRTKRPVLHAVLAWYPSDLDWLTREHLADTVRSALRAMGLSEHQAVWVTHTDTGRPHVHVVANLVHPITGKVARLGLIKKRMSAFCAAYEQALGDVRCKARLMPRAANEQRARARAPKRQMLEKQRAGFPPAPRP
ncbi:MAG: relaxase/mobilization nuclease domain-containing protein [Hyphomicrobium zavarzinii]|uniref:relaxase/mobilization nuclease domain-containing protein n=1 Tax=Hyphomicrobium zavarzinii TaxID=48292 RepID=UPI001A642B4E|nr:relaxase/mobilization nuclease domain-containing protein [Hyphomicrobium zavarzinii]MBL8845581.1 relaxase/mobilization nuclease domain-containing protein [Hyphomicrobium zavarzinii]